MAKGDHIRVFRTLYTHHGIDMGDGTIIHFSGYPGNEKDAKVEIVRFEDFSKGDFISRVKEPTSFSPEEIPESVLTTEPPGMNANIEPDNSIIAPFSGSSMG